VILFAVVLSPYKYTPVIDRQTDRQTERHTTSYDYGGTLQLQLKRSAKMIYKFVEVFVVYLKQTVTYFRLFDLHVGL